MHTIFATVPLHCTVALWQGGQLRKFSSKNAKFGSNSHDIWRELWGRIKIMRTHDLFCQKFAVLAGKLQLAAPPTY